MTLPRKWTSPRAGDKVTSVRTGKTRTVIRVDGTEILWSTDNGRHFCCCLSTWREWCSQHSKPKVTR